MNNQQKLRQLAVSQELKSVDFLDKEGNIGARKEQVDRVRITFHNEEVIVLTMLEFMWLGKNITFKLRQTED